MRALVCSVLLLALVAAPGFAQDATAPEPAAADAPATFEGEPVSHWIELLRADDLKGRQKAVWALWHLRNAASDAAPALVVALRDDDEYVRTTAAKTAPYVIGGRQELVADLEVAMGDERVQVRRAASHLLALVGPGAAGAADAVIAALDDDDAEVRKNAMGTVKDLAPDDAARALPAIRRSLGNADESVRSWAMNSLFFVDSEDTRDLAIAGLDDESAVVRERSLAVLSKTGTGDGSEVPRLLELVGDENWATRRTAVQVVSQYEEQRDVVVPVLVAALDDEHGWVRGAAVNGLTVLEAWQPSTVAELAPLLGDDELLARMSAAYVFTTLGPAAAPYRAQLLERVTAEGHDIVRGNVLRALVDASEAGDTAVESALRSALEGDGDVTPIYAAQALIRRHAIDEPAMAVLLARLDGTYYATAAKALGELHSLAAPAQPNLAAMMARGGSEGLCAAQALIRIGSAHAPEAMELIVETVEDAQSTFRTHAISLAGDLGSDAKPALPGMIAALSSTNYRVVVITSDSLGRLGSTARPALDALREAEARADWSTRSSVRAAIAKIEDAVADED